MSSLVQPICNLVVFICWNRSHHGHRTTLKSPTHLSSEDAGNNNFIPCTVIVSLSLVRFPPFCFFLNLYSIILATGKKWHQWRGDLCVSVLVLFFSLECVIIFVFKKNNLCTMDEDWLTESQDRFEGTWSEFGTLGCLARWARWQWSILLGLDESNGSKDPWFSNVHYHY